jgi:hypothetical protein
MQREGLLFSWHAGHPVLLAVPGYVRWADNGSGCLAITDERTG